MCRLHPAKLLIMRIWDLLGNARSLAASAKWVISMLDCRDGEVECFFERVEVVKGKE